MYVCWVIVRLGKVLLGWVMLWSELGKVYVGWVIVRLGKVSNLSWSDGRSWRGPITWHYCLRNNLGEKMWVGGCI